ncbi:hypothetical protein LCGC14_3062780 [marine sediment metagenome]|uniref:Uncharacterized protein n=1 Tax=marine sediment metagenome TaxID=412755 RepID=A0A0F8WIA0_9ZZZZ
MSDTARNLQVDIQSVMDVLEEEKKREGRNTKSRLLAIAITHLETAKLFVKETEQM